jgi:DNA-directed RNA polymerase III subunit RPC3
MKKSDLKKIISNKDLKVEGLSDDPLDSYLKLLCEKEMSILSKEIDVHGTACYSVRLEQLGESIQLSLITSIIQQRFGDAGRRLWRILHAKGKLDDKQLAKFAMLPMKMTRELLYKMFKAKYVYIQVFLRAIEL